jgi:two-component system, LytTR family, response regulator
LDEAGSIAAMKKEAFALGKTCVLLHLCKTLFQTTAAWMKPDRLRFVGVIVCIVRHFLVHFEFACCPMSVFPKRMSTVIVDDEPMAIVALQHLLGEFCVEVEVVGTAQNASAAYTLLQTTRPDLLFLDIEMPGKDGFDLLNAIEQKPFDVVFTTGHGHYAIKAIRYAAFDYLLKPIDPFELKEVVGRKLKRDQEPDDQRFAVMQTAWEQGAPTTIALPTLNGHIFKQVADITRLEAEDNYTRVFFLSEPSVLVSRTLKVFQDILPPQVFVRLHRSHLVRRTFIRELHRAKKPMVILADGHQIPVSLDKRDDLFQNLLSL